MPAATIRHDGHGVGIDMHATLRDAGVVGLWEYRIDERRIYADRAMALFYGVDPDAASAGMSPDAFREAIHPDDRPLAVAAMRSAIVNGEEYHTRYRVVADDGSSTMIQARARPHQELGRTTRLTGIDIRVPQPASTDPMSELADIAMHAMAIARSTGGRDVQCLIEMLLVAIGRSLAGRLMEKANGRSQKPDTPPERAASVAPLRRRFS